VEPSATEREFWEFPLPPPKKSGAFKSTAVTSWSNTPDDPISLIVQES
jgi:hypothetical protein